MYPKIKVKLSEELDEKICNQFLNLKKAGIDFGAGIIKDHPSLGQIKKLSGKGRNLSIKSYINFFYQNNGSALESLRTKSQEEWNKKEKKFFQASDRLFKKHPWPKGEYVAYLSIFNCNPRFVENKTFQVYWNHPRGFVSVVAHEMLHFLFYDYIQKHFQNVKVSEEYIWQLSEVLDFFILREPEFVRITDDPQPVLYPALIKLSQELSPLWKKSKTAVEFLNLVLLD